MAIENVLCVSHSLVSNFYYMAHHGWAQKNIFKIEVLSWLENASLILAFANTLIHKKAMLLIFYVEHTGCALSIILYPELVWTHHGWACRKIFIIKVLRKLENTSLKLSFGNTVNASFNYTFFHHCTIIYSSTLQKLPELEDVRANFHLNFLN